MKCNQCGTEFDGKFCPACGAENKAGIFSQIHQQGQPMIDAQSVPVTESKLQKKKKPFFLRWWFLLLAIIVIAVIVNCVRGGGERIAWDDIILCNLLPEPPVTKGKIDENAADGLLIEIYDLSDKQFSDYVESCKEKGFCIDEKSDSYSYDAYETEGYHISLSHYDEKMRIRLTAPMEMTAITWPTGTAGKQVPVPKSGVGQFSYEYEDHFFVYVGNTTKTDYKEYVNACSENGFHLDYDKGENYYYADNTGGWHIKICYVGNNIMSIAVDAPNESKQITDSKQTKKEPSAEPVIEEQEENPNDTGELDSEFKAAMDSYENFIDEYVAFMMKYRANPTDLTLIADYTDYTIKYAEFIANFEKWEDEELNEVEAAYFIDVQAKVNKKLMEVANEIDSE